MLPIPSKPDAESFRQIAENFESCAAEWEEVFGPVLEALRRDRQGAATGEDESRRQAGLYVSLELQDGVVAIQHPQSITREECAEELVRLEAFLNAALSLDSLSEDAEAGKLVTVSQMAAIFNEVFAQGLLSANAESPE